MNCAINNSARGSLRPPARAFTIAELMIAMSVFSLMVAGIVASNLYGLRMSQVIGAKVNVSTWSRLTMEKIQNEIHSCKNLQLGTVTNGFFNGLLDGETQQCSSLLIYPSNNTNSFILYYVNGADQTLRRMTDQASSAVIMANAVSSPQPFSAQDLAGNILTNSLNNAVIHLALEFNQSAYFKVHSDYYKFETAVKQRVVP